MAIADPAVPPDMAASSVVGSSTPAGPTSRHTVVAIGVKTDHWRLVSEEFPGIVNCCLDVREAFRRGWDDDTEGTGFDAPHSCAHKEPRHLGGSLDSCHLCAGGVWLTRRPLQPR